MVGPIETIATLPLYPYRRLNGTMTLKRTSSQETDMDLTQFDNPLTAAFLGLFFGLFIALYVAIRGWFAARKLKKDNA